MRKRDNYRSVFMLLFVPLLLVLVASCSSTQSQPLTLDDETAKQWDMTVEKVIAEPERAEKLKRLGHDLIDISHSIMYDVDALKVKVVALNKEYDATEAQLQTLVDDFKQKRNPKYVQYRDILFAMKSEVNAAEWKALNDD